MLTSDYKNRTQSRIFASSIVFLGNVLQKRKRNGLFILTIIHFSFLGILYCSIPPHPIIEQKIKEGKIPLPYHLSKPDEASRRGINTMPILPRLKNIHARQSFLSPTFNAIAILIQFSDKPARVDAKYFDTLLFSERKTALKSYYKEISYGRMDIVTVNLPSQLGWLNVYQSYNYYVDGKNGFGSYPNNAQKMVEDAVAAVDSLVDFSLYDNDGDGFVDALFIIHSGSGAELTGSPNDIWSHQWTTYSPLEKDGVKIYSYTTEPEYWLSPGDMTCGVYAHEMAHVVFGLPDLYDYNGDSKGLGRWSLMASGSWNGNLGNSPAHPDAWSRIQMGFTSSVVPVHDTIDINISPIEDTDMILQYIPNKSNNKEYFLFENRQKIGFDQQLRGGGLLIYHIDESQYDNCNQWYPGLPQRLHYKVALEQADGLWDLEHSNNGGDAGDPYPGSTNNVAFNATSNPNSKDYDSVSTNLNISAIRLVDKNIIATINVDPPSPRIALETISISTSLYKGDSTTKTILFQNTGTEKLEFQIINDSLPEWLNITPNNGQVIPGEEQLISALINTRNLNRDIYNTKLYINTNDPTKSTINVPISLIIKENIKSERIEINMANGWNLLSIPFDIHDNSVDNIFSASSTDAFSYFNGKGYEANTNISMSKGYWMKFDSSQHIFINGYKPDSLIVNVDAGWNLIGTISSPISINNVISEPGDNLTSSFFGYEGGYHRTDTLFTGKGYWIKVREKGNLILKQNLLLAKSNMIDSTDVENTQQNVLIVQDSEGKEQTLFLKVTDTNVPMPKSELPPLPPEGALDVRFISGNSLGTQSAFYYRSQINREDIMIKISSSSYPLTLYWHQSEEIKDRFRLTEVIDNSDGGSHDMSNSSIITLTDPRVTKVRLSIERNFRFPQEYELFQNYPNPFNPTTVIRYELPVDSKVTLKIYNLLGQVIEALVDEIESAGYKSIKWEGTNYANGMYFYAMEATSIADHNQSFKQLKKMMLVK